MADTLIAALSADCVLAVALIAWARLTDDTRTPGRSIRRPKHLRSTR